MKNFTNVTNLPMYSIDEGKHVGQIKNVLFQLSTGVIQGWMIKSQWFTGFSKVAGISAQSIVTLGEDANLIQTVDAVEWKKSDELITDCIWGREYLSTPFLTRDGKVQGTVSDILIDNNGVSVKGFLLNSGAFVRFDDNCRLGKDSAVITDVGALIFEEEKNPSSFWSKIIDLVGNEKD